MDEAIYMANFGELMREVAKYIREGSDYFTVEYGGWSITYDATKQTKIKGEDFNA